MVSKTQK